MENTEKESSNRQTIRSVLATGLKDHPREDYYIEKFYEVADSFIESFEQSTKLSIEDERVDVAGVKLEISATGPEQDPEDTVSIVYKRHAGFFPFTHDHCKKNICWETTNSKGQTVEVCAEFDLPCNIDWPLLGVLD